MRKIPDEKFEGMPCAQVAISCAVGHIIPLTPSRADGYTTLADANTYIRENLNISKSITFKRGERPTLSEFLTGNSIRSIICVSGHFIYFDGIAYWSFFNNDNDEVIRVWYIREYSLPRPSSAAQYWQRKNSKKR